MREGRGSTDGTRRASGRLCLSLAALISAIACGSSSSTTTVGPSPVRCEVSLTSQPSTFPAAGGSGTLSVSAARECSWSAASQAPWITLSSQGDGQGNGSVSYTVAANAIAAERRGTLAVGSHSATITQAAAPCRFDVDRSSFELAAHDTGGTIEVQAPAGCRWTARSLTAWIAIAEGTEGTGAGRVRFTVSANPVTTRRAGAVEVAGHRIDVRQRALPCRYAIDPPAADAGPEAAEGRVAVDTDAGCAWTAVSDQEWLTIVTGETGEGAGEVRYRAEVNASLESRSARIAVAGLFFMLRQAPCHYAVSPLAAAFGPLGGTGQIDVQAPAPCPWSADTGAAWIRITSGASGVGSGRVQYAVPLTLSGARTATITVAGQTVAISQDGFTTLAGQVSGVEGTCPNKRFVIRNRHIRTNAATAYEDGTCGGVRNGVTVRVRGLVGSDGVLTAREVDFL